MTSPSEEAETGITSELKDEWTPERLRKFWEAMLGLYGLTWTREHGEDILGDACTVWRNELMSMKPSEAALGYQACRNSGDCYPCTIPMFIKRVSDALRSRAPTPMHRALPEPKAVRKERMASGREYLDGIKALLEGRDS